jgi:hypothetical protein
VQRVVKSFRDYNGGVRTPYRHRNRKSVSGEKQAVRAALAGYIHDNVSLSWVEMQEKLKEQFGRKYARSEMRTNACGLCTQCVKFLSRI